MGGFWSKQGMVAAVRRPTSGRQQPTRGGLGRAAIEKLGCRRPRCGAEWLELPVNRRNQTPMPIQLNGRAVAVGALLLAVAGPARAEEWKEYAYPDAGFSAQFPSRPTVAERAYQAGRVSAPAKVYAARKGSADYSVTVADLSRSSVGKDAAISDAARAFAAEGAVKVDVTERIDREFGRELTVAGQD